MPQQHCSRWVLIFGVLVVGLGALLVRPVTALAQAAPSAPAAGTHIRFAVIGDYGEDGKQDESVANLVKSWQPEFITTVGDNNYPSGAADTIDPNIGQYYHEYIYPYVGVYTNPATTITENRFWPALGNHDWSALTCVGQTCTGPYFDYFTLPGNERYYDLVRGPVHFFFVDSDKREPDGIIRSSAQAAWLQAGLAKSQTRWQVVLLHHPPYSSGITNGPEQRLQWPYQAWGADAVLTGHEHIYERSTADGIPYIITGLGGKNERGIGTPRPCSEVRYNGDFGAMLVEATALTMTFQFINVTNQLIDTYTLPAPADPEVCTTTRVQQGADDVEQSEITGTVSLDSGDLELTRDLAKARDQMIGVRFQQVAIPAGAKILTATLEFNNAKNHDEPTSLVIHGVAADSAPAFSTTPFAVSSLPQTAASVAWDNVTPWLNLGYDEPTPNIATILQELVNRPGWRQGNAMAFVVTGSGVRSAMAYEGDPERVTGLTFRYETVLSNLYLPFVSR